jgi:hypothetical protein
MKKNHNPKLIGFNLIPHTAGAILGGIWIKDDGSELKIKIAWKDGFLWFKPLKENEKSIY